MPKSRPIPVHVNSTGQRHLKLQEMIHSDQKYFYYPLDGKRKTDLFNAGIVDGSKRAVQLFSDFESARQESDLRGIVTSVLVIQRSLIDRFVTRTLQFSNKLDLSKSYLVNVREATNFINEYCMNCEEYGNERCYQNYDCGVEDRDKFMDGSWREIRKEQAKNRKQRRKSMQSLDTFQPVDIA